MTDYLPGHVKRNPANGQVAYRTIFADATGVGWLLCRQTLGATTCAQSAVEGWDDLYVPEP